MNAPTPRKRGGSKREAPGASRRRACRRLGIPEYLLRRAGLKRLRKLAPQQPALEHRHD